MTKSRKSPKSQILLEESPIKIWTGGRFKKSYTHGFRFQSSQNFFEGSSMCFTENIKMCWRDFDLFQLLDSLISPYQIQIRQIPMLRLSFLKKEIWLRFQICLRLFQFKVMIGKIFSQEDIHLLKRK